MEKMVVLIESWRGNSLFIWIDKFAVLLFYLLPFIS